MKFEGKVTTDPKAIRAWAEERRGWPAVLKKIDGSRVVEVLQICFSEVQQNLEGIIRITWDEFFERFNREQYAFLFSDGKLSRAYAFC